MSNKSLISCDFESLAARYIDFSNRLFLAEKAGVDKQYRHKKEGNKVYVPADSIGFVEVVRHIDSRYDTQNGNFKWTSQDYLITYGAGINN